MMETVSIYHPELDKYVNAKDLEIISETFVDDDGKREVKTYVQFTIVGNNRIWKDAVLHDEFKKHNENVMIK